MLLAGTEDALVMELALLLPESPLFLRHANSLASIHEQISPSFLQLPQVGCRSSHFFFLRRQQVHPVFERVFLGRSWVCTARFGASSEVDESGDDIKESRRGVCCSCRMGMLW